MATVIGALASVHTPQLSIPPEYWGRMGDGDGRRASFGAHRFQALLARRGESLKPDITEQKFKDRHAAARRALDTLHQTLRQAAPDVVVTFGDDQREVFSRSHTPAIDIFTGASVMHGVPTGKRYQRALAQPEWRRDTMWQEFPREPREYPGEPSLATHLVSSLTGAGFDISYTDALREDQEFSHAFGFVCETLMRGTLVPQVPIMVNTYYPPNRPTASRCYELGCQVRAAIERWSAEKRVMLIASGGLSHIEVDEALDTTVLDALANKNAATLTSLPENALVDGTSEIKNWIAVAGAMQHDDKHMRLVDYVPMYRSLAGTGVGAAFAIWE